MGKLNVQSVLYICTLDMTDKASSKLLTSKAKELVYNVSEHFRNEGKGFLERTVEATRVGRTTVVKVRREKTQTGKLQSPTRTNQKKEGKNVRLKPPY